MIENYYTVAEAAQIIGCTSNHLRNLICRGKLDYRQLGPRMNLVPSEEVERLRTTIYRVGRPRKNLKKAC